MKEFDYTIKDDEGVHARPAGLFAKTASEFKSSITMSKNDESADGKRLLEIMALGIKKGEKIKLKASGDDEEKAISVLSSFLEKNL